MDITFHYPPELFELLIDAVPLLCRSKKAVLLFFEGAGVEREFTDDLWQRVERDKDSISKSEIVRTTLMRLNQKGERTLRQRREIIKRVTEFEDFTVCWPDDALKAKGVVSDIRRVVNVKDSFTRLKQELEKERQKHQTEHQTQIKEIKRRQTELAIIKDELFSLFTIPDTQSQKRGKLLEGVMNRLFQASGIQVTEAFELIKEQGEGVLEQIDGVVEIDGHIYLVEMKWWKERLGRKEIALQLVNIFSREHAGGIIVSNSGFTQPAIETCTEALTQKVVVLCELEEIVMALENSTNLTELLKQKIQAAIVYKKPLFYPLKQS